MTWAKLDDKFLDHPKLAAVGVLGFALQTKAILYCARHLTDGFLAAESAAALIATVSGPGVAKGARGIDWPALMVAAGLWDQTEGGYLVHDYLEYNPTKEEADARRETNRTVRVAGGRARAASANRSRGRFTSSSTSRNTSSELVGPLVPAGGGQPAATSSGTSRKPAPYPYPYPLLIQGTSEAAHAATAARSREIRPVQRSDADWVQRRRRVGRKFVPSLEEVEAFISDNGLEYVDAERFYEWSEQKHWPGRWTRNVKDWDKREGAGA
jgi:hypothetical protein